MRKLILKNEQSPGDILMLTAAVRDLHLSNPQKFVTDVHTSCMELWENNPYVTALDPSDPEVEQIQCEYPLIHYANKLPYHFIHGFRMFLQSRLKVLIQPHAFKGEIHLSEREKRQPSRVEELTRIGQRFWIVVSGGKNDYTAKWWDPVRLQTVIDHFKVRLFFVQCGSAKHHHPRLRHALDLVVQTGLRDLINLMHHADGVICPVTMFMHLATAVETKVNRPKNRACVVVAGGREPTHWESYPHHQYLQVNGCLPCCEDGGCWKSRVEALGDGDKNDVSLCTRPIALDNGKKLPECLDMITAQDVIRSVENFCIHFTKHRRAKSQNGGVMADATIAGLYHYVRMGYDERPLELLPDGSIGFGSGACEQTWAHIRFEGGDRLRIEGNRGIICELTPDHNGVFRGYWSKFERMPIGLYPTRQKTIPHANLFYCVAFGDYDLSLAAMVVESIRKSGHEGDVIIFTDRQAAIDNAKCIDIRTYPNSKLLVTDRIKHRQRSNVNYDYLLMRMSVDEFINIYKYDSVFYCDTDILFFTDQYKTFYDYPLIRVLKDSLTMQGNVRQINDHMPCPPFWDKPGRCTGLVYVPRLHFDIFRSWRRWYSEFNSRFPAEPNQDQLFFNILLATGSYDYVVFGSAPEVCSFAKHYTLNNHRSMIFDFNDRIVPKNLVSRADSVSSEVKPLCDMKTMKRRLVYGSDAAYADFTELSIHSFLRFNEAWEIIVMDVGMTLEQRHRLSRVANVVPYPRENLRVTNGSYIPSAKA